jgi:Flp pilus assembly protein TadB
VTANHPAGVMCARARRVSVSSGAMPVAAVTPVLAISVLAWVMIGLPIILVLVVAVMYLRRPKRSTEEIERAQRASGSDAQGPGGPTGRLPGA